MIMMMMTVQYLFKNVAGFGRRMLCSLLALSSIVGAIGRAGLRN